MRRLVLLGVVAGDLARVAAETALRHNVGAAGGPIVIVGPSRREPEGINFEPFAELPPKRTGRPEQTKAQWRKELKGRK